MQPITVPDKTIHQGDWFETSYHIGPMVSDQGALPFGPCLSCRIQYKGELNSYIGYEISNIQGDIIIIDAVTYEFSIPAPRALPLPPSVWLWEFETFEEDNFAGPSRTFYKGKVTSIK